MPGRSAPAVLPTTSQVLDARNFLAAEVGVLLDVVPHPANHTAVAAIKFRVLLNLVGIEEHLDNFLLFAHLPYLDSQG